MAVHVEYIIRLHEECFSQENFSSYVSLRPNTHYLAYGGDEEGRSILRPEYSLLRLTLNDCYPLIASKGRPGIP